MLVRGGGLAEGTKVVSPGLVGSIVTLSTDIGSGSGGSGAGYNPSNMFRESDVLLSLKTQKKTRSAFST